MSFFSTWLSWIELIQLYSVATLVVFTRPFFSEMLADARCDGMFIITGPAAPPAVGLSLYVVVSREMLSPETSEKPIATPAISTR